MSNAMNLMISAATLPPPPSLSLVRKRSWAEMTHVRSVQPTAAKSTLFDTKKSKRTLGSEDPLAYGCCICAEGCPSCQSPGPASIAIPLSPEAQRFLEEDPFDDALPHPVLMRQQAVQTTCDYPLIPTAMEVDDAFGDDLSLASRSLPLPLTKPAPRWNESIVGATLSRTSSLATLQPRRM